MPAGPLEPRSVSCQKLVHRLANLVPLEARTNRRIGNLDSAEKVAAHAESAYAMTRAVAAMAPEEWTPALLEHRQRWMAKRAATLWRCDRD